MKFENYWTEKHGGLFSGKNLRPEVGFLISPFTLTHLSPLHSSAAQGLAPMGSVPRAQYFSRPPFAHLKRRL